MSPNVEEQYKLLTRDNDNAQAFYKDLLAKKSSAALGTSMENQQEGEQMQHSRSRPACPILPVSPTARFLPPAAWVSAWRSV